MQDARADTSAVVWCVWIPGVEFPDPLGGALRSRSDGWVNILFLFYMVYRNGISIFNLLIKLVRFLGAF